MCGNLFGSKPKVEAPKVEKVAPAPQAVSASDTGAADDRAVLTDTAQGKQTLG